MDSCQNLFLILIWGYFAEDPVQIGDFQSASGLRQDLCQYFFSFWATYVVNHIKETQAHGARFQFPFHILHHTGKEITTEAGGDKLADTTGFCLLTAGFSFCGFLALSVEGLCGCLVFNVLSCFKECLDCRQ